MEAFVAILGFVSGGCTAYLVMKWLFGDKNKRN